jgi:carbonic anhydrase
MKIRAIALLALCSLLLLAEEHPPQAAVAPDKLWQQLADGNQRFVAGKPLRRDLRAERAKLAASQAPHVAVLACADSRLAPELLFDQTLGDLFVVRVAGNSADPLAIGSLEYAVEHLGATMIVVMGHESCGAVKAACSGEKMPTANLAAVVAPIERSCGLAKGKDVEPATRDHVHRSAQQLLAESPILKRAADEKRLTIVEAYYALATGKVERLK